MVPVLEQRTFERLGAVHEQAAKRFGLLASNPVARTISANEDGQRCGAAHRTFLEFHSGIVPSLAGRYVPGKAPEPARLMQSAQQKPSAELKRKRLLANVLFEGCATFLSC